MSIKVMTMVFDRYPVGGNERLLALAMADHARDDGTRIWPSIDELSRKTLQSRRTVQRQIANMVSGGWLERVSDRTGRGFTNEYRISPAWIEGRDAVPPQIPADEVAAEEKGVKLTPFPKGKKGVISGNKGVTSDVKGVTAMTPESSEPSTTNTPLPPTGGAHARNVDNSKPPPAAIAEFAAFHAAYPKRIDMDQAAREWRRLKPDAALCAVILQAIELQRQTPEWREDGGRWIPKPGKWLRGRRWLDQIAPVLPVDWWNDADGIKAMGAHIGLPFSLAALGNAYTDDAVMAHWQAYRAAVFDAAGDGEWARRRAA